MNDWRIVSISELCEAIYDGPHATPPKTIGGPIFLGISNLKGGRLDLSDVEHLSEEDYRTWTRRVTPRANDVVFSYETRLGEAALVPEGLRCCLGRRMALMRPDTSKVDPRFLLFAYLSPEFQETIRARTVHGSTVDRIALTEFPSFPIRVPPLDEQRAIAHILGSLDDKIELNRRMNATLEAIARAIFRSWFVDFDPVHAKARGEQPSGMDAATAALFPDSFEESELGMIPRGWRVGVLADMVEIISGGTPKTSIPEYWDGDISWFSVKDVPSDSDVFVIETERTITQAGIDNSAAKILSEGTSIVTARGTVGKLALVGVPMAMNQSCYGIRGIYEDSNYYTFFLLRSAVADLQKNTHGTVFDTITRETFSSIRVISPQVEIIWAFDNLVGSLLEKIKLNLFESRTLAALRDTLLPRLISGELRVPELEVQRLLDGD